MDGRTAVVTGAAGGLGQAIATRLATASCNIAIIDLGDASETASLVTAAGRSVRAWRGDVSDADQVAAIGAEIDDHFGGADVLINNAGVFPNTPFESVDFDEWRRVLSINLDSQFLTCKAFYGSMRRKGWGRIVNLSSGSCWLPVGGLTHYIASKMGIVGFTRALATDLAPFGITVNAVAPTLTKTPGTAAHVTDELFEAVPNQIQAIKRPGTPEELAAAVAFLAGEEASLITGQTLMVDGGAVRL